jgi:hypothetical protein
MERHGRAGHWATVTSLASGDHHCASGGASVTDGNGNTACACNGAVGPAGSSGFRSMPALPAYQSGGKRLLRAEV